MLIQITNIVARKHIPRAATNNLLSPRIALIKVVLPAPLAPLNAMRSRPVTYNLNRLALRNHTPHQKWKQLFCLVKIWQHQRKVRHNYFGHSVFKLTVLLIDSCSSPILPFFLAAVRSRFLCIIHAIRDHPHQHGRACFAQDVFAQDQVLPGLSFFELFNGSLRIALRSTFAQVIIIVTGKITSSFSICHMVSTTVRNNSGSCRHNNQSAIVVAQHLHERAPIFCVKMVCGLIKGQHIGLMRKSK